MEVLLHPSLQREWSKPGLSLSNLGQLPVHLVTHMGTLNANGVAVLVSSLSVIICFVKSLPETLAVLYVLGRVQCAALTVKEQASARSG